MADYSKALALLDESDNTSQQSDNSGQMASAAPSKPNLDYSKALALLDEGSNSNQNLLTGSASNPQSSSIYNTLSEAGQSIGNFATHAVQGGADALRAGAQLVLPAFDIPRYDAGVSPEMSEKYPYSSLGGSIFGQGLATAPMMMEAAPAELAGAVSKFAPTITDTISSAYSKIPMVGKAMGSAFATTDGDVSDREKSALLAGGLTSVPSAAGSAITGSLEKILGTNANPKVQAAFEKLGIKAPPTPYLTGNTNAQKYFENQIAMAPMSGGIQEVQRLSNDLNRASDDLINKFDQPYGISKSDVEKNMVGKINDQLNSNKINTNDLYKMADMLAERSGESSSISLDSYRKALSEIASGEGHYTDQGVRFANKELELLDKNGQSSGNVPFQKGADLNKVLNKQMSNNVGANHDRALHHELTSLKDALNNDIDSSLGKNGAYDVLSAWREANKSYATTVAPFYSHKGLNQLIKKGFDEPIADGAMKKLVKTGQSGNPTEIKQALSLVPGIQKDLGYLVLKSPAEMEGAANVPELNSTLKALRGLDTPTAEAVFTPDQLEHVRALRDAYSSLGTLPQTMHNVNTGQKANWANVMGGYKGGLGAGLLGAYTGNATHDLTNAMLAAGAIPAANVIKNAAIKQLMTSPKMAQIAESGFTGMPKTRLAGRSALAGTAPAINNKRKDKEK